ncbi:hypothetical protein CEUSTIGMA_g1844.t1 [Chlamydomonas eustigma]|uniref:FAS1 domain-containing protein n=1 Tax=Chlamydomonas eustigma TaxID=1157962 RepID=A0A250WUG4_9CHLO|nr:hypothetical protein CEUSTIGMA_g1844.t1 [Chlamydomonas eustigma]|eukprot:GAX74396.1 hypothetical protein CEUSTIGMA_g1844.t1 [Chlamydomonas eustigma]
MQKISFLVLTFSIASFVGHSFGLYDSLSSAAIKLKLPTLIRVASSAGIDLTDQSWTGTALLPAETGWSYLLSQLNLNLTTLLANRTLCKAVLQYHIIPKIVIRTSDLNNPNILTPAATMLSKQGIQMGSNIYPNGTGYYFAMGWENQGIISKAGQDIWTGKGGIVDVISQALVPLLEPIFGPFPSPPLQAQPPTLLLYVSQQPDLSNIYQIAVASSLGVTLSTSTSSAFTFFAPNNTAVAAFAKKESWTLQTLLHKPSSTLSTLFQPLIVPGKAWMPMDLTNLATLTTASGTEILVQNNAAGTITLQSPKGSARITSPPVYIGDAVMYCVDGMLQA